MSYTLACIKNKGVVPIFLGLLLVATSILMGNPASSQNLPGDHGRWIGTIEGSMVDEQGSGLVYDFRFSENGTVNVEKSMTVRKLIQEFTWSMQGNDIILSGDANGPIGELSSRTLTYVDETRYEFKHVDGETDVEIRKSKPLYS